MSELYDEADIDELFMSSPTWMNFDLVPLDTPFYSRRGLAYVKTSRGSARDAFDENDVYEDTLDDADVFDDWPYFVIPTRTTGGDAS